MNPPRAPDSRRAPLDRATTLRVATIVGLALVVAVRLGLTGDRDILAVNEPFDDYWFVRAVTRGIWGGDYDQLSFAQLQTYALWLWITREFGIPARLAIDLLWLGGAAYLASAIARLCTRAWPGVACFVFLALHPYSIVLFDRALSENFTAGVVSFALGAFLDVWTFRRDGPRADRWKQMAATAGAAVCFAVAYHARKEGVVLAAPLAVVALGFVLAGRRWWTGSNLALCTIVIPALVTLAMGIALAAANAHRWGVFARYELAAPDYVRAINDLNAIDPGGPTPKWVTVTAATRAKAYAASPTFRELARFLDGPMARSVVEQTELYFHVKGEIGNGWFYWSIREAAAEAGWHRSAATAEAKYAAMADELEAAFAARTLAHRSAPLPFVDPQWTKWLPDVPAALVHEVALALAPSPRDLAMPRENADARQRRDYLDATGRRKSFDETSLAGWLVAPPGSVVGIGRDAASIRWTPVEGTTRPDVPGAYALRVDAPLAVEEASLFVRLPNGEQAQLALAGVAEGRMVQIPATTALTLGVDRLTPPAPPLRATRWLASLCTLSSLAGWTAFVAALAASARAAWTRRFDAMAGFVLVALAGLFARAALLAVLDTSSWSGTQARYLLPAVPMVALAGVLSLCALARGSGRGSGRIAIAGDAP